MSDYLFAVLCKRLEDDDFRTAELLSRGAFYQTPCEFSDEENAVFNMIFAMSCGESS